MTVFGPFFVAAASITKFGTEPSTRLLISSVIKNNNKSLLHTQKKHPWGTPHSTYAHRLQIREI